MTIDGAPPGALLLAPGAGGSRTHRTLLALDEAIDVPTSRIEIKARNHDKVMATIDAAAEGLILSAQISAAQLVLGGRSYGGRMCSVAVAEGLPARGLILLSYPLHPPGKPETLRVDHFDRLNVPVLFVSGTRDAFGTPKEFERHVATIPGEVTQVWVEGADHAMRGKEPQVVRAVTRWINTLR